MTSRPTHAALRSDEKAAIVLFSLGTDKAGQLFRQMDASEHKLFAQAFNRLGNVGLEQISDVLLEFMACLQQADRLQGGAAGTKDFLLKILDPTSVDQVMNDIDGSAGNELWQRLSDMSAQRLAAYVSGEKPQTVAVILSRLRPDTAAATLMLMPEAMAREIVLRLAHMRQVDQEVIQDLQSSMMSDFLVRSKRDEAQGHSRGVIASMLSEMPNEQADSFMAFLHEEAPEAAGAVQEGMFRFDDIPGKVTPTALQLVIRNCDKETLVLALRMASQKDAKLADFFLENMSKRAADQLREDMEGLGTVRAKDAQKAQAEIVRLIQQLARKGEIVLSGKAGDEDALIG